MKRRIWKFHCKTVNNVLLMTGSRALVEELHADSTKLLIIKISQKAFDSQQQSYQESQNVLKWGTDLRSTWGLYGCYYVIEEKMGWGWRRGINISGSFIKRGVRACSIAHHKSCKIKLKILQIPAMMLSPQKKTVPHTVWRAQHRQP